MKVMDDEIPTNICRSTFFCFSLKLTLSTEFENLAATLMGAGGRIGVGRGTSLVLEGKKIN